MALSNEQPHFKAPASLLSSGTSLLALFAGPFAFSFIGGYLDAAGYVLAKTFTGHITGAFVLFAISAAATNWQACLVRLAGIVCFLIGLFIAATMGHYFSEKPPTYILSRVIAIEIVLIVLGYVAARSSEASVRELLVLCLSLALGMQNGVWWRIGGISVHTTYLTGLVSALVATEVDSVMFDSRLYGPASKDPGIRTNAGVWVSFLAGAMIGAFAALHLRESGILGAALLLVVVFCLYPRIEAQAAVWRASIRGSAVAGGSNE